MRNKWFVRKSGFIKDSNKISTESALQFLKKDIIKDFYKLPEVQKIIIKAIVWEYKVNSIKPASIPEKLKLFEITPSLLEEFKMDFGYTELERLKGEANPAYRNWLRRIGLSYESDRKIVQRIIRGIYAYTGGQLDYRNARMRKQISYEQHHTKENKDKLKNQSRLYREFNKQEV